MPYVFLALNSQMNTMIKHVGWRKAERLPSEVASCQKMQATSGVMGIAI